jgi:hypothetical protein
MIRDDLMLERIGLPHEETPAALYLASDRARR